MNSARDHFVPGWSRDLEAILVAGAKVDILCDGAECPGGRKIDLLALMDAVGPRYCLWNRRPVCPVCGRPGGRYRVQPRGAWQVLMWDCPPSYVAAYQAAWQASLPDEHRDGLALDPMMTATSACVAVGCGECAKAYVLDRSGVSAWGDALRKTATLDLIRDVFAAQCPETACEFSTDLIATKARELFE